MKLSEVITEAEKAMAEHGDIPVLVPDPGCGCCSSYIFEVAEVAVKKDAEAYLGGFIQGVDTVPAAFVVS